MFGKGLIACFARTLLVAGTRCQRKSRYVQRHLPCTTGRTAVRLPFGCIWMQAMIDVYCPKLERHIERDQSVQEHTGIQPATERYDEAIQPALGDCQAQRLQNPRGHLVVVHW